MPVSIVARALGIDVEAVDDSEIDYDAILAAPTIRPEAQVLGDIRGITPTVVSDIVRARPGTYFGVYGGPPCVDVTRPKGPQTQGALGEHSGLRMQFGRVAN